MPDLFDFLFQSPAGMERLAWQDVGIYLLSAFVLGQLTAWVYVWTHHGLSYSRSMVQSLVLMSLIVTTVMLAIGFNIATAFGLFGALALVRFRTPVKDTRDTAFLFMAVGIGVMVGSRNLMLAVMGTSILCLVALYLSYSRFGERHGQDAMLRFLMPALAPQEQRLRQVLQHHCRSFALVHLRDAGAGEQMEFAYQVKLHDPDQTPGLLMDMRSIEGIVGLNLLMQSEDEAV